MKGRLFSMKITPTGVMRLYGARVYAKVMDPSARSGWQWFDLPVTPPDFYSSFTLPVPQTPDVFSPFALPVPETPDVQTDRSISSATRPEEPSRDRFTQQARSLHGGRRMLQSRRSDELRQKRFWPSPN